MQPFAGLLLLCHAFGLSLVFADCADITVFYFLNFTANRHKAAIIPFVATLFPSVAAADSFGLSAEVCNAFCSHRLSVVPWGGLISCVNIACEVCKCRGIVRAIYHISDMLADVFNISACNFANSFIGVYRAVTPHYAGAPIVAFNSQFLLRYVVRCFCSFHIFFCLFISFLLLFLPPEV